MLDGAPGYYLLVWYRQVSQISRLVFLDFACASAAQLSPVPAIKLQKSIQLGNTPVCLRVQYEVPLDGIDEPLKAPARFFLR